MIVGMTCSFPLAMRVARDERDPALSMEAVHFVQDLAAGTELALISTYALECRKIGPVERGQDLVAAERVVARERLVLAQPAKLVEHAHTILMAVLVEFDLRELDLGTAGERRDQFLRLEIVIAGNRL